MQKNYLKYFFILLITLTVGCAKRGTITGGAKDTIAPVLTTSFPKNRTVNFNDKQFKLVFDEYCSLQRVNLAMLQ